MTETQTTKTHGVTLSDVAAGKVKSLLEQEGRDDLRLRIGVQPGGRLCGGGLCSGGLGGDLRGSRLTGTLLGRVDDTHDALLPVRPLISSQIRNGAPKAPVITPTGTKVSPRR